MKTNLNDYDHWSKKAHKFDNVACNMDGDCSEDSKKDWINSQFKSTDVALELGCGTGTYSAFIADKVKKLIATDMSDEMLEIAKKKLQHFTNIEISKEDCYNTSFKDNTFDSILLANVLHIVSDPVAVLKEGNRVLKKNGRIIVTSYTFFGMPLLQKFRAMIQYVMTLGLPPSSGRILNPTELKKLAEEAGIKVKVSKLIHGNTYSVCLSGTKT